MAKFQFSDQVDVVSDAPEAYRPGERACVVVGIYDEADRKEDFLEEFPHGWVYTIEFGDGTFATLPEEYLVLNPD